jgi:hypothetical protein
MPFEPIRSWQGDVHGGDRIGPNRDRRCLNRHGWSLPTTARIVAHDIAASRSTAHQDSSKVGTDISPLAVLTVPTGGSHKFPRLPTAWELCRNFVGTSAIDPGGSGASANPANGHLVLDPLGAGSILLNTSPLRNQGGPFSSQNEAPKCSEIVLRQRS